MADWRYIASRLNGNGTETLLHTELPLTGVSITDTLSGPQAISASITPEIASLVAHDGGPVFEPWSTAIYAEKDGAIRAGTILADMTVREGSILDLDCIGFAGYPKDQPYTSTYSVIGRDAIDIMRDIWKHLQSQTRGNIGLKLGSGLSGIKLGTALKKGQQADSENGPYKLAWYDTPDLLDKINELVKLGRFDYRERHAWSGDTVAHYLDFGSPQLGRRRADLRFMVGENVSIIPDTKYIGDDYADEIMALGSGEGSKMVKGVKGRPGEKRLRRAKVIQDRLANTTAKALAVADKELRNSLALPTIDQIKVWDHPHAPLGSWAIGDEIFVQSPEGWQGNLALWARVISHTITPDDESVATLNLVPADRT